MSDGLGDNVKGNAKEIGGKAQEGLGDVTGNTDLQAEGQANQLEGKGQQVVGNVKNAADNIGDAIGDVFDGDKK
ncbi:MAG TPA: CsbD family protein [Chloroflexia bacterium]|nr:CsbD family protein [Chloroflexia bacterium]